MARPKRAPTREVQNEHGMYPTVRVSPMTPEETRRIQAQFDGLKNLDAELLAIFRYASQVENDCQDQGVLDNARLLKTAITHELPRLLESGDLKGALALTLSIGRLFERIFAVVNYEPAVRTGRKTTKASKNANDTKKANAANLDKQIQKAVSEKIKTNGHLSIYAAGQYLADEMKDENDKPIPGWSWGKIKNAIRGMKKPKR